jgi:hypothetical protein
MATLYSEINGRQAGDRFWYDRDLELYRLQLNRTTNEETRRQILRLMMEETNRHL